MTRSLQRLAVALLAAFVAVGIGLGHWTIAQREALLARDDNPRRVLEEQRIRRGQIVDRNGIVLAGTISDDTTSLSRREYPYPESAPVVGYYSLRYGVSGIEARYDDWLRGDSLLTLQEQTTRRILHRPQIGGNVQLTLDYQIQQTAARLLGERAGAVVVISVPQGEVLAMASQPTFDPNTLEVNWDDLSGDPAAPLLNRATQALYQPGTILQSIVLGTALDANLPVTRIPWEDHADVPINGAQLECAAEPARTETLIDGYLWGCPAPFQMLAIRMDARQLDAALISFGLLEAPIFPLPTGAAALEAPPAQSDLFRTVIGQSHLTVTPLQMALVAGAFSNHGEMPALQLVKAVQAPGGVWEAVASEGYARGTISRASTDAVARWMSEAALIGGAQAADFSGERVFGHAGLALAGPRESLNAWFIGFVYRSNGDALAVAVLLEEESDAGAAAQLGGWVLQTALEVLP